MIYHGYFNDTILIAEGISNLLFLEFAANCAVILAIFIFICIFIWLKRKY